MTLGHTEISHLMCGESILGCDSLASEFSFNPSCARELLDPAPCNWGWFPVALGTAQGHSYCRNRAGERKLAFTEMSPTGIAGVMLEFDL